MSINVREAKPGDEVVIAGLVRELAGSIGEPSPVTEEYVASYLSSPGSFVLLAEENDQVVGLLSYSVRPNLYHAGNSALIEELIVHGSARRRGVGSVLVTGLLERLTSAGCVEVSVSTMPDNVGAQRFYKSHGLVEEAVFLEKHL